MRTGNMPRPGARYPGYLTPLPPPPGWPSGTLSAFHVQSAPRAVEQHTPSPFGSVSETTGAVRRKFRLTTALSHTGTGLVDPRL